MRRRAGEDHTSVLAGSIGEPNELRLAKHIFVAGKGGYYDITDGLPRHDAYDLPPSAGWDTCAESCAGAKKT